jgi:predicted acetyltransferase
MTDTIRLERGHTDQRAVLDNLLQLYIHDFQDFMAPERKIGVQDNGRFPDLPELDSYWTESSRAVWFIRVRDLLAGFALINRHSHSGLPVDFNVGEFFVMRPFRRDGIATRAVANLLKAHPGQWEVAIAARNIPAQAFWPRAVASSDVTGIEHLQGDGVTWTGPILRFLAR